MFKISLLFGSASMLAFMNYYANLYIEDKKSWLKVSGKIVKSMIEDRDRTYQTSNSSNQPFIFTTGINQTEYRNVILYEYSVNGSSYVKPYMNTFWTMQRYIVEQIRYKYKEEKEIDVWYDPDKPWLSEIERDKSTNMLYGAAGVLCVLGVGRFIMLKTQARQQSADYDQIPNRL